jgi:hypothetical protein
LIGGESTTLFMLTKESALTKCAAALVRDKTTEPCPDFSADARIEAARSKVADAIRRACGGKDKTCGGFDPDDVTLNWIGWNIDVARFAALCAVQTT